MKIIKQTWAVMSVCVAVALGLAGCETTSSNVTQANAGAAVSDHEPRHDYWSGACCPHHANELAKPKKSGE